MKKKKKEIQGIEITKAAAEGKSIGKYEDQVVFVTGAVPGDVVDVRILKKKKSYLEGMVINIQKYSEDRVQALCAHYGVCGGCKWQDLNYEKQLAYKHQQVLDQFTRLGGFPFADPQPILASPDLFRYRNKMEYTFSNSRWFTEEEIGKNEDFEGKRNALGFHVLGRYDKIVDVTNCFLQPEKGDEIRNFIRENAFELNLSFFDMRNFAGDLRTLTLRSNKKGEWMLVLSYYNSDAEPKVLQLLERVEANFSEIKEIHSVHNPKRNDTIGDLDIKIHKGIGYLVEELDDLRFRIAPKSFFQTNSLQAETMYRKVKELAQLTGKEIVYDLYTGTGTIACYVAKDAQKVVGLEYVEDAVRDAKINAEDNKIENTTFFAGDMKDLLTDEFIAHHGKPDIIITDPPRAGMHDNVIAQILKIQPQKIVYVSCNPATQARDISLMQEFYNVIHVQPLDMFPHTHHVENIALLARK
jgi:23S rRNA (uracil1939-C5)-methyltransferase